MASPVVLMASTNSNNSANSYDDEVIIREPGQISIIETSGGIKVIQGIKSGNVLYEKKFQSTSDEISSRSFYMKNNKALEPNRLAMEIANGKSGRWSIKTGGLGFGLNGALGQEKGTGLQWGKSFDITWLHVIAGEYKFGRSAVSLGLGLDWKNFKMTGDPYRMVKLKTGGLGLHNYPDGTVALNSTLKIFSLGIPVLYSFDIPKVYTKFTVGPVINFNTYSSLKTNYLNAEGNKIREFKKDLGQKKVTFDIFGSLSWDGFGLYMRYSPIKSMKSFSDVNFTPMTLGFIFFL